jgi:hypothetical protein
LGLTIRDLRNARWRSNLRLSVGDLRSTAAALVHSYNVDGNTLCTSALAVQVVEGTRETLVPYGRRAATARECEGAVAADREASGLTSTSLQGSIELESIEGSVCAPL